MASGEDILKGHELFKSLDSRFIGEFISKAQERKYAKGEVVYVELSEGDEIFLILKGSVRVSVELATSKAVTVDKGNFFGLEMFIQKGPRSVTAAANTDLEVWVWKTEDWQVLCEANPKEGYRLLLRVAQELHKRMHLWTETVLNSTSWGIE